MNWEKATGQENMCLAVSFPGCSDGEPPAPVEYVIGVSQANMREPWRLVLAQELRNEAEKHPQVRLVFTDATSNSDKQITDIQRLQGYGIDLLIVSPHDAAELTPIISEVYQTTPVIVLDRMVEGFNYTLFIGPDNHLIGKKAGETIIEMTAGKPCAVLQLCGNEETKTTVDRSNGFMEAVTAAPLITIDSIPVEQESRDAAEAAVLSRRPELDSIDLIFAHNDYMALGAHRALQQLGLEHIRIVGIDGFTGEDRGLEMVRSGVIDRTITCPTGGREAIRNALDILGGVSGVPKQIILRSSTIDAQNLDRYEREMNQKIRPPKENIRVGYVQIGTESQWRLANNRSIIEAAKEFDVDLTVVDGNQSQQRQIEAIRHFIAEDMDVIVLSPVVDTGWNQVLREAMEAGIPVLDLFGN